MSNNSLRPHESQRIRPPCPSPNPGVHSDSHLSSPWCHPSISSSVIPFSCPQSLPVSESFPMSQLFAWGGQSTGVSALASFLPKKSHKKQEEEMWICAFRVLKVLLGSLACAIRGVTESQMWLSGQTKTTVIILYVLYYLPVCAAIPACEYPYSQTPWIKVFAFHTRYMKSISRNI